MEGIADRKHADNYQSNRQRQNTVQIEKKCTNVGFSRLVEQEWGNKEQHKELGFQVNLLDVGQHERNKQTDNNLDNGDGDVDKLVDNRGSRDAGQNNEHKFECLQQASFLIVGDNGVKPAARAGGSATSSGSVASGGSVSSDGSTRVPSTRGFSPDNASFEYIRFYGSSLTWRR